MSANIGPAPVMLGAIVEADEGSVGHDQVQNQVEEDNIDITPSARAKVLPWVTEIQASHEFPRDSMSISGRNDEPTSAAALAHANHVEARQSWMEQEEAERQHIAAADAVSGRKARGMSVFVVNDEAGPDGDGQGDGENGTSGPPTGPVGKSLRSDAMSRGAAIPGASMGGPMGSGQGMGVGATAANPMGHGQNYQNNPPLPPGSGSVPPPMAFAYPFAGAAWGQQAGLRQSNESGQPGAYMSSPYGHPPFLPAQGQQFAGQFQPMQGAYPAQVPSPAAVPAATAKQGPPSVSMLGQAGSTPMMNNNTVPGAPTSPGQTTNRFTGPIPALMDFAPVAEVAPVAIPVMMPQQPVPLGLQMGMFGTLPASGPPVPQPFVSSTAADKSPVAERTTSPTKAVAQAIIDADVNAYKMAQAKLFHNAAESYAALEKETRAREAERQKALEQLAGLGIPNQATGKPARAQGHDREASSGYETEATASDARRARKKDKKKGKRDRSRSKHRHHHRHNKDAHEHPEEELQSPLSPRYMPTTEGNIKTHEFLHFADGHGGQQPKRSTQDTQPTTTSGPSFGHFGRPFSHSVGAGLPSELIGGRGVPIVVLESASRPGFGFGGDIGALGLDLADLLGSPREKMSAYVETVEDEDDHAARMRSPSPGNGHNRGGDAHLPQAVEEDVQDRARDASARGSEASVQGSPMSQAAPLDRERGPRRGPAQSQSGYTNLTTMSVINELVSDSRFHDEALCEILAAAQNPQLGEAARKTLRRAAKDRVISLMKADIQGLNHRFHEDLTPKSFTARKVSQTSTGSRDSEPPSWSKALFEMLAETQARLEQLEHSRQPGNLSADPADTAEHHDEENEAAARAALHNLLFPDIPVELPVSKGAAPPTISMDATQVNVPAQTNWNAMPGWPVQGGPAFPFAPMIRVPFSAAPPVIQIQPPTVANTDYAASRSRGTPAPTTGMDSLLLNETITPKVNEGSTCSPAHASPAVRPLAEEAEVEVEDEQDIGYPRPWDIATQRLYSWALVWPANEFKRALERTALGYQVEEFALTIYTMMIFKRNLRHRMSSIPPLPCDKLFVPPNMADAINRAVHAKRFHDARQILEELWYPFGFKTPPRVIVALAKHRNDSDHWAAHRFDLLTARLVTMSFSNDTKSLLDGRPFMWWFAIREAWPEHNIPHPDHLAQKTHRIITSEELKDENSLAATNASRNFLLGWRPERETDMKKLRENIWQEVKRLYNRKTSGRLIIDPANEVADDY